MKLISYTLAIMAGLCLASGLFILSDEGDIIHGENRNNFRTS